MPGKTSWDNLQTHLRENACPEVPITVHMSGNYDREVTKQVLRYNLLIIKKCARNVRNPVISICSCSYRYNEVRYSPSGGLESSYTDR